MGGLAQTWRTVVLVSVAEADNVHSWPPCILGILGQKTEGQSQTIATR